MAIILPAQGLIDKRGRRFREGKPPSRLALQGELSYNSRMTQPHRPGSWLLLALAAVLVAALVLWMGCAAPSGRARSPLPTPSEQMTSPLPTPAFTSTGVAPPLAWTMAGAVLLWVALGVLLGLGVALVVFRRHRRDT